MLGNGTVKDAKCPKIGSGRHLQAISRNRAKKSGLAILLSMKGHSSLCIAYE